MLWALYNCLFPVVFLLMLPKFLARMWKRGGYRRGFLQRLGWYDAGLRVRLKERPRLWIHAVSVGEIQVALHVMRLLRRRLPGLAFTLTTATSTGYALASRQVAPEDVLLYFPVDLPPVMDRVIERLRPLMLVLVEGELWPNLLRLAARHNVPVLLLNGRLSERSFRRYRLVRPLARRMLACIECFCMQSEADARRMAGLGADPARIRVTGSAKYDRAAAERPDAGPLRPVLARAGFPPSARWLVGGSTWPGEERALLALQARLRAGDPAARLALIPRHAERRAAVLAEVRAAGLTAISWREAKAGASPSASAPDVVLVDTTGELQRFYDLADVVFVGKSLTARGGQNLIEPAAYAKPVIVGPHMANFEAVLADFLGARAVLQVADAAGLDRAVRGLWNDEAARREYGRRAAAVVRQRAGALDRSVDALFSLLLARAAP